MAWVDPRATRSRGLVRAVLRHHGSSADNGGYRRKHNGSGFRGSFGLRLTSFVKPSPHQADQTISVITLWQLTDPVPSQQGGAIKMLIEMRN